MSNKLRQKIIMIRNKTEFERVHMKMHKLINWLSNETLTKIQMIKLYKKMTIL